MLVETSEPAKTEHVPWVYLQPYRPNWWAALFAILLFWGFLWLIWRGFSGPGGDGGGRSSSAGLAVPPSAPTASPHASAAQYKVIVNGVEAVGQGPGSLLSCNPTFYRSPRDAITIAASNPATVAGPGNGSASALVTNTDSPQVVNLNLYSYPNKRWSWQLGQQPGSTAVTKTGNTYHIVGTIPPAPGSPETQFAGASLAPFEFDATCP
jgi:hypothetical protein